MVQEDVLELGQAEELLLGELAHTAQGAQQRVEGVVVGGQHLGSVAQVVVVGEKGLTGRHDVVHRHEGSALVMAR